MKRRIKDLLGRAAFFTGTYRSFFRDKAVVVLFHRVDDRYAGNPISCTEATFVAFCKFFRRYFIVVPLSVLLEKLARGDDIGRHLAITFDDGYRDNSETAAPILRRAELPACFFIATEFIGSDRVPWWDAEAGIASEWMRWDQVIDLHRQHFEIGAHTKNHVDLGVVTGPEAVAEIVESGVRLATEVGAPIPFFTYPYGRPNQITEVNREIARDAGYVCCLSAFGGTVRPGTDPFRIQRTPISPWHLSPFHFGFEAMIDR